MNERQEKIRKVIKEAKEFASGYGIVENDLMTRVIGQIASYYAVYASPKDKIEPVLSIYGNEVLPNWNSVKRRTKELEKLGLETKIVSFPAYGNECCQITRSVLNSDKIFASYLVFHESVHIQTTINKLKFANIAWEESFADGFAYYLQKEFFFEEPEIIAKIDQEDKEYQDYYRLMNRYYEMMKQILILSPERKEELRKGIILDAMKRSKKFNTPKIRKKLTSNSFNNASLLHASYYFPQSEEVEKTIRQTSPHKYIHSRKDLANFLKQIT